MALHLNFYHEIQKDAHVRARDPIKLAGFAAGGVAILLLAFYFYRAADVRKVEADYATQNAEWLKAEPALKRAMTREVELLDLQKKNASLVTRLQGRLYWAPVLQHLAEATPNVVQMTRLEGSFINGEATLLITGLAAGEQARLAAEQFRSGLEERFTSHYQNVRATFDGNSLEETGQQVTLEGKPLSLVRFSVRLIFKAEAPAKEPSPEGAEAAKEALAKETSGKESK